MRWWGWGEDGPAVPRPPAAETLLRDELGADPELRRPPVAIEKVRLPDPDLPAAARERLVAAVGGENVRDDRETRIRHAVGRSYPDLVRIRSGDAASAPDAVVLPASAEQVVAILAACSEQRIAVVPFGGGTSVVGGVEPVRDGMAGVVTLDLSRLSSEVEVDRTSLTAKLDAGLLGPDAERRLREQGVTLGHFPQSFEYSTVGGWLATRSAGQASTGYGRIDELVEAVLCVTPAGALGTRDGVPASAAGPRLRELVVGSEGVLGVICEATVRVRPAPAAPRYEGWSL
jgi:alkyldihydroxyacetonephosphate synthase